MKKVLRSDLRSQYEIKDSNVKILNSEIRKTFLDYAEIDVMNANEKQICLEPEKIRKRSLNIRPKRTEQAQVFSVRRHEEEGAKTKKIEALKNTMNSVSERLESVDSTLQYYAQEFIRKSHQAEWPSNECDPYKELTFSADCLCMKCRGIRMEHAHKDYLSMKSKLKSKPFEKFDKNFEMTRTEFNARPPPMFNESSISEKSPYYFDQSNKEESRVSPFEDQSDASSLVSSFGTDIEEETSLKDLDSSQKSDEAIQHDFLVPSLFPYVPPHLSFSESSVDHSSLPPELKRVLRFRISNITPKVVRNVVKNTGWTTTTVGNDWVGVWGRHLRAHLFKTIRAHQKINHLPGSFSIGRKDSLWCNIEKLIKQHGRKAYGYVPETYLYPKEEKRLKSDWRRYEDKNTKWIIKPPARSRGVGIRLISKWDDLPKRKKWIVQRYIERPLLINGNKFDMRIYALVTSMNPLRIYIYKNGLARFATEKYSTSETTLSVRCMHLTNYSVNRHSANYAKTTNTLNEYEAHKWPLETLYRVLKERGVDIERLQKAINRIVMRTIIAGELSMVAQCKHNLTSSRSAFELFGFDILLDEEARPWLLEVNISPSLHTGTPVDLEVKAPLVTAVLNTVLFNLPPRINTHQQLELARKLNLPVPFTINDDVDKESKSTSSDDSGVDPDFNICYDQRLTAQALTDDEILKRKQFPSSILKERPKYLHKILECLTPDDVRVLIQSEDELSRSGPLERIFPTKTSYKYFKYFKSLRYYNCLLDAWEHYYGGPEDDPTSCRDKGIALLQKLCSEKYHLTAKSDVTKSNSSKQDGI